MMKQSTWFILCLIIFISCSRKDNASHAILTERIQYDVFIKSPDPDLDWWVQNIEGSKREVFVKKIIDIALSGKVKTYDYSNQLLTPAELKSQLYRSDTFSMQRANPPYQYFDTVVTHSIDMKDIVKIRFLEEWLWDEKTLFIQKKIAGIAPIAAVYMDDGELKGYKPLFWIYFDDDYPLKSVIK
jgi:hypothetical protein